MKRRCATRCCLASRSRNRCRGNRKRKTDRESEDPRPDKQIPRSTRNDGGRVSSSETEADSDRRLGGVRHGIGGQRTESEIRRAVYQASILRPERHVLVDGVIYPQSVDERSFRLRLRPSKRIELVPARS